MKESGFTRGRAALLDSLEARRPKNPVCLHLRGDQPRGTSAQEVRHQSFELRHDSIGGKVTMGYHPSQKSSDHHRSEIRSTVIEPSAALRTFANAPIRLAIPDPGCGGP